MSNCSEEGCTNQAYQGESKCILHCDKQDYSAEFKTSRLPDFFDALVELIVNQVRENARHSIYDTSNLTQYLRTIRTNNLSYTPEQQELFRKFLKERDIHFRDIYFPPWEDRDYFNYTKLFPVFKSLWFIDCKFKATNIGDTDELSFTQVFFDRCEFLNDWHLENLTVLKNIEDVLYQSSTFHRDVSAFGGMERHLKREINVRLFCDCNFKSELQFQRIKFTAPLFNNSYDAKTTIEKLSLVNCVMNEDARFILNNCQLTLVEVNNTVFHSKVEFKENLVDTYEVINSNFLKIFDAYGTKFKKFSVFKSIFEDFAGFEDCEFGESGSNATEYMPVFMFATFTSFVTFRSSRFFCGLDIQHTNLKDPPNFLNATIAPYNTNRETFRIIKNSFDGIGNHIEANRYYAYEMQKYRAELKQTGNWQERFLLFLNEGVSEFGQNYWRPIVLMFIFACAFYAIEWGYEHNTLYTIYPPGNNVLLLITNFLNGIAKAVMPISRFLRDGMEFISLLYYAIYATLIWQTLVAIKRHTKR